ncbi:ligand-binding sensor domain-containing protein [Rasiella sp. SM2506]|uniref:ligand-binding sensor domain-containing protein n=1 Tax=Rasiella sp. SM2506 TaxID=3423914 RepID=UPI003D7BA75C
MYFSIRNLFSFFLLLLILGSISLFGQNPSQIDELTTQQGLMFREVIAIEQDNNGFMWFATPQGINRYDGYNFKVYNSDKNNPYFIEEDKLTGNTLFDKKANVLWYLANDKLFALDLETDMVIAYNEKHTINGKVLALHQGKDGTIWIITDDYWKTQKSDSKQYLLKYNKGRFEAVANIPRNNRGFVSLNSDAKGNLWFSTTNGTRKYTQAGAFITDYDLDCYDFYGATMHFVRSYIDSKNNHYFFPKTQGGIHLLDGITHQTKTLLDVMEQFNVGIEDSQNKVWFAGSQSLYRMDEKGGFTNYTDLLKSRFDYSVINDLFIDENNLLWIATDNGLFKIRIGEQLFDTLFTSQKKGWGNTMRGMFEDNEGTLYGLCESSSQIIYRTSTGRIDTLHLKTDTGEQPNIHHGASFFVVNDAKTFVYSVSKELLKINLKSGYVKQYKEFIPNVRVYGSNPLVKLADGRLLFGYTLSRLTLFDPITEKSEPVFKDSNSYTEIEPLTFFAASKEKNIVWVGTQDNGLLKLNLNGSIEKVFTINSTPSIRKNHVLVVDEDTDGSIWVGTYGGGLTHISADGKTVKSYTKPDGLPDNNIVGILTDGSDNLWLSTYNGLSYFSKRNKNFQNYYTEDGLSHNEFNYSSFFKDSNDTYYFGGMNGVSSFTSKQIVRNETLPCLRLTGYSGYNSRYKESYEIDTSLYETTTIEISPYDQYFQINWTMPSYFQNDTNKYSTTLEGYEDRWFFQGSSPSVRYNKLPAGEYILKIKGADARGNETSSILSIPITVRQFFYKKWWFIALVILLNVALVYALFKWRLQQLLALEQLRTKISSDLHDDVGSLLSGLAMQTELMEINASQEDKTKLQKIAGISRNAISQMRDLVWSIDNRRTTSNDLIERMHELAEELLLPRDVSFNINSEGVDQRNKKLAPQIKQNLFLIYKEAITNLLKHSDASHLQVTIANQAKNCLFKIKDNGSTKENYSSTGLGLSNIQLRAEAIGGTVTFETTNGFAIILKLPFQL